jgi:hypothetical protein
MRARAPTPPAAPDAPGVFPWRRPRRELLLLALVAAAALSPIYSVGTQDQSRLCLTRALVHVQISNDSCLKISRDRARYGGHLYSDKAPGMSVLEVPSAVAVRLPNSDVWPGHGLQVWATRVLSSGIAFILCVFLIGRMSEGLAPGFGGMALIAFALGTLAAPFAAANFGHVTAGTLGFAAFALAWRRRPLLAGLAAGAAIGVEYPAFLILVILAGYVALQGRRTLVRYLVGTAPGATLLAAYNWAAFGAPWHLSYRYVSKEFASEQSRGFFGVGAPRLHAIHQVFVGGGGLLRVSPVLVAAALGLVVLGRRFRAEAIVCGAVTVVFLVMNCGYFNVYGGVSPGPRFLIPALPFVALGLGPAFASRFRITAVLTAISIVATSALTLTWATDRPPDHGAIWGELWRLPRDLGHSWLVQHLVSSLFERAGLGIGISAAIVALVAVLAFALALPVSLARPRRGIA